MKSPTADNDTAIDAEMDTATAREETSEAQDSVAAEMAVPEVNQEFLSELKGMGFGENRSIRALHHCENASLEAAVTWLADHENDVDLDDELLVPKVAPKPKLSAEEAKAVAAELVRKAREKRAAEEAETERRRELERIRVGKELAAAAKAEEAQRLKRNVEQRRLEKLEEARAREKIRAKLEEDRRERRRRMGLPEELTEEEKEAERKKAEEREKAQAAKKLPQPPPRSFTAADAQRDALVQIKKDHVQQDAAVTTCFQTLLKFCANAQRSPEEKKYRHIRLTNAAVQQRLLPGSVAFLEAAGWRRCDGDEGLDLPTTPEVSALLQTACELVDGALKNPFFGML